VNVTVVPELAAVHLGTDRYDADEMAATPYHAVGDVVAFVADEDVSDGCDSFHSPSVLTLSLGMSVTKSSHGSPSAGTGTTQCHSCALSGRFIHRRH
jgi:hypothetical protein